MGRSCAAILVLAGCSSGTVTAVDEPDAAIAVAEPDAAPGFLPEPTEELGGDVVVEGCGWKLATRPGATAPWLAPPDALVGADPTPRQLHLGLAGDPARSMVILWRTVDDTTRRTAVRVGRESAAEQVRPGYTFSFRSGASDDSPRIRMHEVHLCGLEPDTVYRYQAGSDAGWSPEYTFRTAPDRTRDPSAQVSIAVLGDSRGGQSAWGALVARAESVAAPDVIFFTGDAVSSGAGQAEWDAFLDRAGDVLPYVPLVLAHGNHEANAVNFYSLFAHPGNEEWFGLDYGPVHLTVLNDTPLSSTDLAGVEREFLDADLAAAGGAPWRLVMHHRSMWSASGGHGSSETLQRTWGPVVDAHGVDLVLSGHDHDYERTRSLRAGSVVAPAEGTVYVVAGGAGAPLYASGTAGFTAYSESRRHVVILAARAGRLDGRAIRDDGTLMDSFALLKEPP